MDTKQLNELLLQSLEHEKGGVQIYETALHCVQNEELEAEWTKYLEQTRKHVQIMEELCEDMGLDVDEMTPGRKILHGLAKSLVQAMEEALDGGDENAAQLVACECVVLAETKDHLDWELIGECAKKLGGAEAKLLKEAYDLVEEEEDEHLYHSKGWCRELWIDALGMRAVLPPPEERKDVKTAIGAARAEQQRGSMR
jgi:hypothetical protein